MKQRLLIGGLMAGLMCVAACGSSGGSGSSSSSIPTISSISDLPTATSPMSSSASAMIVKGVDKAATTGLNILTTTADNFSDQTSIGACNTFNSLKDNILSATQADMILCFVQNMDASANFSGLTDSNGHAIDIYDGAYHIFNLNFAGVPSGDGAPNRIKMKIAKDGAGSITSFEMFMCRDKTDGSGLEQSEYTKQTIDGTSYTMRATGSYQDSGGSGFHWVNVSGTLNSSRKFISKTITVKNDGSWGGGTNWGEQTLVQAPASFTISGYHKGSFVDTEHGMSGSYEDKGYALGQMLGDATGLSSLAMGDGAVLYGQSGSNTNPQGGPDQTHTQTGTDAWLGDGALPTTSNDYLAGAIAGALPTAASSMTISFEASETWDCTDDVSVGIYDLPQVQFTTIESSCSKYMASGSWINCFQQIGSCNMDNMCQGATEGAQKTACEACFPNGLKNNDTFSCLIATCQGGQECVDSYTQHCSD
ncbi:MAG: hypothetical protein V2A66_06950 [Pseudomonadota bacterium]